MKSIEIKVPRNLIQKFYPHPEPYGDGDYVVDLINGMYTDVFYREEGDFVTITNGNKLITYLKKNKQKSRDYFFRNGVYSLRIKEDIDYQSIKKWELTSPILVELEMPAEPFRAKAKEYITRFMREMDARHTIDVMETVIRQLESDFSVSKQAAKIRLVELGIEEAVGTFTYLDGHYVKPHSFRKGVIKLNQTFSIGAQDAAVQRFVNPELRKLTENGDYLFVDNHYVYNAPLYVESDKNGKLELTSYARARICVDLLDMSLSCTACPVSRQGNAGAYIQRWTAQYF